MKFKTISGLLFALCLLCPFIFSNFAFAQNEEEKIKVGYYVGFTDIVRDIDSMHSPGYGYEVFKKMEEISDLSFEFVPIEGDLIDAIEAGIVDVGGFGIRTDSRKEKVVFSQTPYSKTYVALMTDDMDIRYNTPSEIDGKTVATYEDNYAQQYLDIYCGWYDISVEYVYGDVNNYMNEDADFYITYSEDDNANYQNNVLNLGVFNLYLMTSLENEELMAKIDEIFYQIVTTEGNFFLELEEEYLSKNLEINHRSLTQIEVDILSQRTLEVGYIDNFRPISYVDENGEAAGAMVETLNLFADRYDFEVNYHPYNLAQSEEAYEKYDLLLTLYGEGEQIYENYVFTESYYDIAMYAKVHYDIHKESVTFEEVIESAPKIGVLPYQSLDYKGIIKVFPDNEFVFYDDFHSLLDAFANREVDMIIFTESATPYAELYLDDIETITMHTDLVLPMMIFVSKDISETHLPIFNIMLDRINRLEYEGILIENSNTYYPEKSLLDTILDYWYYYAIAIISLIAFFIIYAILKQIQKQKELLTAYNQDALTGFYKEHKFREIMEEVLQKAKPKEYELVSLDVDMFKTLNTHFSAEKGTEVIVAIARGLEKAFDKTSAVLCRSTADHYLILRRVDLGGTLRHIYTNDILPNVREIIGDKYNISMSFGIKTIDNCNENSASIIGKADSARASGKHSHKTTYVAFDEKMRKQYEDKVDITFRMEQALKDNEFYVEYQPKIDFATLKIGGLEALVRWEQKFGTKVYPDEFIPIFEENGFIATLDLFVFEEVCKFIRNNYKKMNIPRISVNLSAHTVLSDYVLARITSLTENYEINPEEIELELTESAIENDTSEFLSRVKKFKKLGFNISIDDFGAGVSSLNRLSSIEADVLKLDKAFFNLKEQGGKSTVVVADVISMAKHLDMKVVAEGVETSAQAMWLKSIQCDYAQGYYFAKPMSENKIKELLISEKQYTIDLLGK